MNKYFKYIKYILLLFLIIILLIYILCSRRELTIEDVNNLMIIAHKEDGLIWGANNLVKDNYLVVCITCNSNDKDFINIMNKTNDMYVFLAYDDSTEFYEERNILNRDMKKYLFLKKWDKIVTHNEDGEYGSNEHITINNCVNKLLENKDNLYYFNNYYSTEELEKDSSRLYRLNESELDYKVKLISYLEDLDYVNEFRHIIPYEYFITYKKWGDNDE